MPIDPTGTGKLRSRFRSESRQRVALFLRRVRETMVNQDLFGLYSPVDTVHPLLMSKYKTPSQDAKLTVMTNFIQQLSYAVIVHEGDWLRPHMDNAFVSGMKAGETWAPMTFDSVDPVYYAFARNELEGVVDALIQQVSRVMHTSLVRDELPRTMMARIAAVSHKIEEQRINALGHMLIVQQHNLGRLAQIKAAGIKWVGVIPEGKVPRRRVSHDAMMDQDEVNVQTAEDDKVCDECLDISDNGPYTSEFAETLIPAHINCRCALVPSWDIRYNVNLEQLEEAEED